MAEQSSYKSLEIFASSKKLVLACYALTHELPVEEKLNLTFFIRNAALTAHVAVSQGIFLKKDKARKKFVEKARNALVVIDAVVEVLVEAGMIKKEETTEVMELSSHCFQQLNTLLKEN